MVSQNTVSALLDLNQSVLLTVIVLLLSLPVSSMVVQLIIDKTDLVIFWMSSVLPLAMDFLH